jgi:hypothetical protein
MKWGSATPLGQARASACEIAISRFDSFRPRHPFEHSARLYVRTLFIVLVSGSRLLSGYQESVWLAANLRCQSLP